MKKHTKTEKLAHNLSESLTAAASRSGETLATVKAAKAEGCPAFLPGNRIDVPALIAWIALNPSVRKKNKDTAWKAKIEKERHRKLKMENDETERTLIKREWMAERVHVAAGKCDAFRQKSEAEHPLLFSATTDIGVAKCREVVRKIWDEIMASLNTLEKEFRE